MPVSIKDSTNAWCPSNRERRDIKKAFRKLARNISRCRPKTKKASRGTNLRNQRAYEVLGDPAKRKNTMSSAPIGTCADFRPPLAGNRLRRPLRIPAAALRGKNTNFIRRHRFSDLFEQFLSRAVRGGFGGGGFAEQDLEADAETRNRR